MDYTWFVENSDLPIASVPQNSFLIVNIRYMNRDDGKVLVIDGNLYELCRQNSNGSKCYCCLRPRIDGKKVSRCPVTASIDGNQLIWMRNVSFFSYFCIVNYSILVGAHSLKAR